jgi:hypothetical protein
MRDPLQSLSQTKPALLAAIFVLVGAAFLIVVRRPGLLPAWMSGLPLTDLGSAFFVVIAFEYSTARTAKSALTLGCERPSGPRHRQFERLSVLRGFAVEPEDLKRLATPELLDQIAESGLGPRFGDQQFAREVYGDIRDRR